MAVTCTREQREAARKHGLHLVTIAVPGVEFQGPVPQEEKDALLAYLTEFFGRRYPKNHESKE